MDVVTVFREVLGAVDDAIALADDAVKSAEDARVSRPQESVTLVKVAQARYQSTADALYKTGAFRGYTRDGLRQSLEGAGTADLLEFMEKLASVAVFSLDTSEVTSGDLVEKSADSRTNASGFISKSDVWRRALDEAERECAG